MMLMVYDKEVKIRKIHYCDECKKTFPVGTVMQCLTRVEEYFTNVYICSECQDKLKNKVIDINWDTQPEVSKPFKGTPDEYLSYKRAQRMQKV